MNAADSAALGAMRVAGWHRQIDRWRQLQVASTIPVAAGRRAYIEGAILNSRGIICGCPECVALEADVEAAVITIEKETPCVPSR